MLWKILGLFNRRDHYIISGLGLMMLISAALETLGVGLVLPLMSLIMNPEIIHTNSWLNFLYTFLGFTTDRNFLIFLSLAFMGVFVGKNVYALLFFYCQERFFILKRLVMHSRLYTAYLKAPYTYHLENNSTTLMRNIDEVGTLFQSFLVPLIQILTEATVLLCIVTLLVINEPTVAMIAFLCLGGSAFIINRVFKNQLIYLGQVKLDSNAEMNKAFFQGLGGIKDVQALRRETEFIRTYDQSITKFLRSILLRGLISQSPRLIMEVVVVVGMLSIIFYLLMQEKDIATIVPTLSFFALAVYRIMGSMSKILSQVNNLNYSKEIVELIYNEIHYLDQIKSQHEPGEDAKDLLFQRQIELKNISFHYPKREQKVINHLSLTIPRGAAVAFAGPSGAGKTTLVDIILGLLEPTEGQILADNLDIQSCMYAWRKSIGYIPQFVYICDDTVRRNVAFGIPEDQIDENALEKAIEAAQLKSVVDELPEGMETMLGERGVKLSGGQRQRIGIARAIYHDPSILILDEATSSLDGETEREVTSAINRFSGKKTLIIIAHRLTTVKNCDTIYFMQNGQIIDSGSYDQLMSNNTQFQKMAGLIAS